MALNSKNINICFQIFTFFISFRNILTLITRSYYFYLTKCLKILLMGKYRWHKLLFITDFQLRLRAIYIYFYASIFVGKTNITSVYRHIYLIVKLRTNSNWVFIFSGKLWLSFTATKLVTVIIHIYFEIFFFSRLFYSNAISLFIVAVVVQHHSCFLQITFCYIVNNLMNFG